VGAFCPAGYGPRATPDSDLVRIVDEHLPAFIERIEHDGDCLPGFVLDELEGLRSCGDFERGFVRLCCTRCGDELRVPFACKGRGICPSCVGRRMCETAANWVEGLLPEVPYRQWVLSFDSSFAVRLGYDAGALDLVCRSLARHIGRVVRRGVKKQHGLASVTALHPGLITVVQRFRSDLGLFVHLHVLVTDGAFEKSGGGVVFHPLSELDEVQLVHVVEAVAADLAKAGLEVDFDVDACLAVCTQLSLSTLAPTSSAPSTPEGLAVSAHGMSLHAASTVDGRDRKRLERLCKYLLRPAFAQQSVRLLADGRVRLELPRKGRAIDMTPEQFLGKLCALVPPPRFNMVRYAGVFANRHHLRPFIVPAVEPSARAGSQLALFDFVGKPMPLTDADAAVPTRMPARSWSWLLARVFSIDIETCPRRGCGGRLRLVEVVADPERIALYLHGARAPPAPSPPGQLGLSLSP